MAVIEYGTVRSDGYMMIGTRWQNGQEMYIWQKGSHVVLSGYVDRSTPTQQVSVTPVSSPAVTPTVQPTASPFVQVATGNMASISGDCNDIFNLTGDGSGGLSSLSGSSGDNTGQGNSAFGSETLSKWLPILIVVIVTGYLIYSENKKKKGN